jgi:Ankyrin repeats (many copies)
MAKAKKKLLPKDFVALLAAGELDALKAVFETCDVNARGGYGKQPALAFDECPDELAQWLVAEGADIAAADEYGATPLHVRAASWRGRIESLIRLGANVNHNAGYRGTPLHTAAGAFIIDNVRILLAHGADATATNRDGDTALAYALSRCSNINIENMSAISALLLDAGVAVNERMQERITKIGTEFEFHRSNFNPESVEVTSVALDKLYKLFGVAPVPRRIVHDSKSPIRANAARWQDAHQALWALLVPSSGAADTVQGEAIRVSGRIHDEIERNGGANWDADYKKMADALVRYVELGNALHATRLSEVRDIVAAVKKREGDASRLCAIAVEWVALNPTPLGLSKPDYLR